MDTLLDTYDLPKLNQKYIKKLNRSTTNSKCEVKNLLRKKSPGPNRLTAKFYKTFKEELKSRFLKPFHKTERDEMLSDSFYEASTTLIPKPDKDTPKKKKKRKL
jgi:hypothetical protein